MKLHEKYITEESISKDLVKIVEKFKNMIRDDFGKPLGPSEIKYIKSQIDRLAKDYKGM